MCSNEEVPILTLPPVICGKYSVDKMLEVGTFGEVLKAFRTNDHEKKDPVTIRTFREKHKKMEELDTSEIEIISQISHDNVVRVHDTVWHINSDGGVELYLVYHFCNMGDLDVFIQDHGRLSEVQVQDFVQQMGKGMKVLRKHGIIHRDLKPSAILVQKVSDEKFSYKIADMGLTKLFFDDMEGVSFSDHHTFLAPEVIKSRSETKLEDLQNFKPSFILQSLEDRKKIDLWSLGILILTCLNGEVPYKDIDMSQYTSEKEINVKGQLPKGTNVELENLITSLLRFNPSDRLDFTSFLRHPFIKPSIWFAKAFEHRLPCSSLVTALACDSKNVICGLETGLIEIFDRNKSYSLVKRLDSHRKTVSAVAINKEIIITGSQDTTIAVWSRESFERLQMLYHHRNTVIGIEIIGQSAYSACLDGTHKAFSIDYKKLYARRNGFGGRRLSISEHSNEEFREEIEFCDPRSGKTYPAHWRDHDHMHSVAGIIVTLIYVVEDQEFRPFHILSSRAFNSVRPQLTIRMRDDGNENYVRTLTFDSHVRQVQQKRDQLVLLHWDGQMNLFSANDLLSSLPNDELLSRKNILSERGERNRPTWFCMSTQDENTIAYYNADHAHVLEFKL